MASMNHVILAGNLTANPEIRYTAKTGTPAVRMQIAVNRKRKGKEEVAYVPLIALGKTAEFANQYLQKGSGLLIEGRLQTRTYEKDGQKRTAFEVLVNELQLLDRKNGATAAGDSDDTGDDDAALDEEIDF
jgi:single-strand DNA-binding protein